MDLKPLHIVQVGHRVDQEGKSNFANHSGMVGSLGQLLPNVAPLAEAGTIELV